jgi:hypothetical protein
MLYCLQTGATSNRADSWGTPAPATILVIQMDPFPIPHRKPSAPASINRLAPSPVAIEPATMSTFRLALSSFTVSMHSLEWPFATSTTSTSTPAETRDRARSSSLAPTAAPT